MTGFMLAGWPRWRLAMWGGAAALLMLPFVAMQFTGEVNWTASDFLVFGAMLAVACGAFELAMRMARTRAGRIGAAMLIGGLFLLLWAELAVGIFGPG